MPSSLSRRSLTNLRVRRPRELSYRLLGSTIVKISCQRRADYGDNRKLHDIKVFAYKK